MAKNRTVFFCQNCGYESAKWMGQCPACRQWNTFVEEPVTKTASGRQTSRTASKQPSKLSGIQTEKEERIKTGIDELDRVLGGGIVPGSMILVGGDPGIGKSTLLLQVCQKLSAQHRKIFYISGEESLGQIKLRADRIGRFEDDVLLLCETDLEAVENVILKERPEMVVIDSIQTMYKNDIGSAPGSVSQVRESTNVLMNIAKTNGITIFIVGHVTKEGVVAGPRVLEHMVDTVLYFEGERHAAYRLLRSVKNRFGSTNEMGVFEMAGEGLKEVKDPSKYMLSGRPENASGSVVTCVMEGTRPMMVEVQALVCRTNFNMPRRTAAGMDYNRVNLLMAVVEKRLGISLGSCDAYVNIAGGVRINDPSIDLAVVCAILSSYKNIPVSDRLMVFGEVGLVGEVRAVRQAQLCIREGEKLGFDRCILPKANMDPQMSASKMLLQGVENLQDIYKILTAQ
ncbi:MAG TPA: DNA repair protein RadA [Candidatus Onthocola gallistercoris]|uniref:DNA repair protein RadA n=1 Tax=Candidatus Onthocola gallistercoris TaxID=2840876 RepID=A0A9D1HHC9_9FIRM|nr:DNA repair protein RadA [Candidatus Onthocola gallistercoris]